MNLDWHAKFEQITNAIGKAGEAYAQAKATSWNLQELKSVVLARKAQEFTDMPQYKQEAAAKASKEYEAHIQGTTEAIRQELLTKVRYEKLNSQFEAYRSLISLDKKTIEKDI